MVSGVTERNSSIEASPDEERKKEMRCGRGWCGAEYGEYGSGARTNENILVMK